MPPESTTQSRESSQPKPQIEAVQAAASTTAQEGARAASKAARTVTETVDQQTRQLSEDLSTARDALRESTAMATDRMNALLSSYSALAGGLQEVQRTYFELLQHSMEVATAGPRELIRCRDLSEVANVQRDLWRKGLDEWLDGSAKLLEVSSRAAANAAKPIQEQLGRI